MSAPGFSPMSAHAAPYGAADAAFTALPVTATATGPDLRRPVDPNVFVNAFTRPLPTYQETFSGPGYESKPLPTSPAAVAALVCGIVGVFTVVGALAAVPLGHIGLVQTQRNTHLGRGMAIGGMVLGYAVLTVAALITLAIWIAESA